MIFRDIYLAFAVFVLFHVCRAQEEDCNARMEYCRSSPSDSELCSGRGTCECGNCICASHSFVSSGKYSGQYCECDDYSCMYSNNKMCGGHGRCSCGVCRCDEGYQGEACGCPLSNQTCLASNRQMCNGNGICDCGTCKCSGSYKGPTCEECPTCPGMCQIKKPCAMCVAFQMGSYNEDMCAEKCQDVKVVEQLKAGEDGYHLCQFRDDDDCRIFFTYFRVDNINTKVEVQSTRECPKLYGYNADPNNPSDKKDDPSDNAVLNTSCFLWTVTIVFGIRLFT